MKTRASRYKRYAQFRITKASSSTVAVLHLNDNDLEDNIKLTFFKSKFLFLVSLDNKISNQTNSCLLTY